MRNPTQSLDSVDNALRVLMMVSEREQVRVSDVAAELGVAASTSHRLLATLKHRGFVEQQRDRSYVKGPAFTQLANAGSAPAKSLEEVALPILTGLRTEVDETTHLMVQQGTDVRFILSVEGNQALRVTSRAGVLLPAHRTSGGKALLACLPPDDLDALYPLSGAPSLDLDAAAVASLRRELAGVRRRGYGVNRGESERGIAAVGMCIIGPDRRPVGAFSISVPTVRFNSHRLRELVAAAARTRTSIEMHWRPEAVRITSTGA